MRIRHGITDWFKIGKGVCQSCILSPCLFNLYVEYIMWNARLDDPQAGIKIPRRTINNLQYADDTTLMAESKEEWKSLLMRVKEKSEKGLKTQYSKNKDHGIWSHYFMANRRGEEMETVTDFIFLGSKIIVDSDSSHEIKRCLLLVRKAMTNIDNVLKSRDINLPTKVHIVKAVVLPVVMYGCGSWTIKKAEPWRSDAFKLWCWGRLLRVPWIARRSNQSILKEINSEDSLEGLMLKMKLQYFGHLLWRAKSLELRRQWQPTPVLLPGKSHGQRSLVGCSPWVREESDMTEWLHFHFSLPCIGEGDGNPLQWACHLWGRTEADWSDLAAAASHWKRSWSSERLKVKGEVSNRGWDGWIEFEQTLGASEGQEDWCTAVHGVTELDSTQRLNNYVRPHKPSSQVFCLFDMSSLFLTLFIDYFFNTGLGFQPN